MNEFIHGWIIGVQEEDENNMTKITDNSITGILIKSLFVRLSRKIFRTFYRMIFKVVNLIKVQAFFLFQKRLQ